MSEGKKIIDTLFELSEQAIRELIAHAYLLQSDNSFACETQLDMINAVRNMKNNGYEIHEIEVDGNIIDKEIKRRYVLDYNGKTVAGRDVCLTLNFRE